VMGVLPVVGSLSLPCPSSGRRLGNLSCSLIGCLCLGLAPRRPLLRGRRARRLSPSGVLTLRSKTPSPTYCLRSPSGIAPYSGKVAYLATFFRDARRVTPFLVGPAYLSPETKSLMSILSTSSLPLNFDTTRLLLALRGISPSFVDSMPLHSPPILPSVRT